MERLAVWWDRRVGEWESEREWYMTPVNCIYPRGLSHTASFDYRALSLPLSLWNIFSSHGKPKRTKTKTMTPWQTKRRLILQWHLFRVLHISPPKKSLKKYFSEDIRIYFQNKSNSVILKMTSIKLSKSKVYSLFNLKHLEGENPNSSSLLGSNLKLKKMRTKSGAITIGVSHHGDYRHHNRIIHL